MYIVITLCILIIIIPLESLVIVELAWLVDWLGS